MSLIVETSPVAASHREPSYNAVCIKSDIRPVWSNTHPHKKHLKLVWAGRRWNNTSGSDVAPWCYTWTGWVWDGIRAGWGIEHLYHKNNYQHHYLKKSLIAHHEDKTLFNSPWMANFEGCGIWGAKEVFSWPSQVFPCLQSSYRSKGSVRKSEALSFAIQGRGVSEAPKPLHVSVWPEVPLKHFFIKLQMLQLFHSSFCHCNWQSFHLW